MKNKKWTAKEIEYLQERWGNISVTQMAYHLNRTPGAVREKASRLGLGHFLQNGDEYVTKHQLCVALGIDSGSGYTTNITWKKRGLPTHRIKRLNWTFDVIYIDEFWKWAEKNQSALDFSRFEMYALGPEPEWVNKKRKRDYHRKNTYKASPWTQTEDRKLLKLLREFKYSYKELSHLLNRTTGAIQRRICDLGYKERPIKADNHILWTDEQWDTLADMIKQGYSYEEMSDVIGKSSKAIRGRVFDMYLTERLDVVRGYLGSDGSWGDNRPEIPLKYRRLLKPEEKEYVNVQLEVLSHLILNIVKEKTNVEEPFREYWQKDMCVLWDDIEGCTAGESNCDYCSSFKRIPPQFCTRCGATFYNRKPSKICDPCKKARIKQAQKKYAVMHSKGRM